MLRTCYFLLECCCFEELIFFFPILQGINLYFDQFLQGDNQFRSSGQAQEFKHLNIHAWEAFEKGQDIHLQAAPSQAELLYKEFQIKKEKLKSHTKEDIMDKYGNAASEDKPPMELLMCQTERLVEYDLAG